MRLTAGYFGSANSSQTLFTIFEMVPVIVALVILSIVPISRWFPDKHDIGGTFTHGESNAAYEMKH